MHLISHDNHLHRQHSRFSRDVRRRQCRRMNRLYCQKHLERHRAIGMVRDDRTWPLPIHFANGIAICVPKDPNRQFLARQRFERCWLEWLQVEFHLFILHWILTTPIFKFTSNSGWNYRWLGGFDQQTFTDWYLHKSCRWICAKVRLVNEVRWRDGRSYERCSNIIGWVIWWCVVR